ncbi:MAG: NAD(P)H-dependent oxidoreductase [Bacteroidia bacterium]|nr:NAD(P)H-dependent oxidoreductase [Bacteroidia bacterium]
MKVTIILGSIREGRKSDRVAKHLHALLEKAEGVEPYLLDLREHPLPQYEYRWADVESPDPNLPKVGQLLANSDGMILVSPEYHGSYTGVLKNAIDHYWKEFGKKVIGVVSTGSGRMGGINASTEMQQLILSLGAYPIPKKLLVPLIQEVYSPEGEPQNEKMEKDANKFVHEFLWLTQAVKTAKEKALSLS